MSFSVSLSLPNQTTHIRNELILAYNRASALYRPNISMNDKTTMIQEAAARSFSSIRESQNYFQEMMGSLPKRFVNSDEFSTRETINYITLYGYHPDQLEYRTFLRNAFEQAPENLSLEDILNYFADKRRIIGGKPEWGESRNEKLWTPFIENINQRAWNQHIKPSVDNWERARSSRYFSYARDLGERVESLLSENPERPGSQYYQFSGTLTNGNTIVLTSFDFINDPSTGKPVAVSILTTSGVPFLKHAGCHSYGIGV